LAAEAFVRLSRSGIGPIATVAEQDPGLEILASQHHSLVKYCGT
jgi:hypothetical protein